MLDRLRTLFQPRGGALPTPPSGAGVPGVQARAAYEGAARTARTQGMNTADPGPNMATLSAPVLRARCRDAVRNDSWARAIVETLTDDVIGWGIKPLSRSQHEPFRQAVQRLWEDWTTVADADGVLDIAGLQAAAFREMVTGGECFIRLRRRLPADGLPVPLQIQVLPAEICPSDYTQPGASGHEIRQGIEYDAIGRRVAYWLYDTVPGEDVTSQAAMRGTPRAVPAAQVLHLFDPLRPGQRRGVPWLSGALVRLHELDKYADATLLRLQLASMFVAVKKTTPTAADIATPLDPITGQPVSGLDLDDINRPVLQLAPGTFQELLPGEDLQFSDPPDPPVGFDAFVKHELRAAGAALGVPLEAFSGDWGATNDRLARVVLNQYRRRVHRILWSIVVPQFLRPLWLEWFRLALTTRTLPMNEPTYLEDRLGRVTFSPHAHAYVHPVQDVASYKEAMLAGLTSRAAAVAETGEDVELIDAQIAADNARADKLGLKFTSDGRPAGQAAR